MTYIKRQSAPKNWPTPRKGTRFVAKTLSGQIPILVLLRDLLKIAQNRREVKKALYVKNVLLNQKPARDERQGANLFDVITIVPSKKNYKLSLTERGKFALEEIKEADALKKIAKVESKKTLKGKKTQLNLSDGNNFISNVKCNTNDSVIIDLKNKKIKKCLSLKEKANVLIFTGKHAGKKGVVIKIDDETKNIIVKTSEKEVNVLIKQVIVTE